MKLNLLPSRFHLSLHLVLVLLQSSSMKSSY